MPAPFDKEETKERLRKAPGGPAAPLNVHLRQEIDRLNIILRITSTTLKNLRLAVAGADCRPTLNIALCSRHRMLACIVLSALHAYPCKCSMHTD